MFALGELYGCFSLLLCFATQMQSLITTAGLLSVDGLVALSPKLLAAIKVGIKIPCETCLLLFVCSMMTESGRNVGL